MKNLTSCSGCKKLEVVKVVYDFSKQSNKDSYQFSKCALFWSSAQTCDQVLTQSMWQGSILKASRKLQIDLPRVVKWIREENTEHSTFFWSGAPRNNNKIFCLREQTTVWLWRQFQHFSSLNS